MQQGAKYSMKPNQHGKSNGILSTGIFGYYKKQRSLIGEAVKEERYISLCHSYCY